ncbi:MAG: hypothetical protein MRZ79_13840 [Bacteroidia bacterium]|nr:hypothetical protein [Bacteroidia bacterium]
MQGELFNHLADPPAPWRNRVVLPAAGILASGWTSENKVFLLSSDGYSISDPVSGEREIRNRDEDGTAMDNISEDNLEFHIPELNETIKIFGLSGGNGNHLSRDHWELASFHPALGQQIVGIRNIIKDFNHVVYWKSFKLIRLERLEHVKLTYGFSPSQKNFGIFGSAGAEIFTRT